MGIVQLVRLVDHHHACVFLGKEFRLRESLNLSILGQGLVLTEQFQLIKYYLQFFREPAKCYYIFKEARLTA